MISYSRARSLSASVRRAWSGSRLSRSLRTGRTTETPSGSGITLCRIPPRPMPSPGHRGCGLPTEKMRPPWHTAHRDLLVALEQMTVDERVGPAEVQIGAGVHDDVAEEDGRNIAPLEVVDHPALALLGLGEDEVRLPERRLAAEEHIEGRPVWNDEDPLAGGQHRVGGQAHPVEQSRDAGMHPEHIIGHPHLDVWVADLGCPKVDGALDDDGQPGEPHHERQQHRGRSRAQPWTERCDEAGHQDDEGMETLREVLEVGARERVLYVRDADEAGRQDKLASRRIVARRD